MATAFEKLFAKNVPHISEKIFLSLDYETFKKCHEVCKAWRKILRSDTFKNIAKVLYYDEMLKELFDASTSGNTKVVRRLLSSRVDVHCAAATQGSDSVIFYFAPENTPESIT